MRLEDEGIDPRKHDYDLWHQTIEVLIAQRRIWVATDQGRLSFVIEIGTRCSKGTQIGSTYVPPNIPWARHCNTRDARHRQPPLARHRVCQSIGQRREYTRPQML